MRIIMGKDLCFVSRHRAIRTFQSDLNRDRIAGSLCRGAKGSMRKNRGTKFRVQRRKQTRFDGKGVDAHAAAGRTGMLRAARYRFTSPTVYSPKWKMLAARTASAFPSSN